MGALPTEPGDGPHRGGLVRTTQEIALQIAPRYLGDVHHGIQEHLRPMLKTYSRELGGVPLNFQDVKPVSQMAKILYENPGVHVRVSTSLLLFAPKIGDVLVGRVNFIGHDHVGLTVYDAFKASISQLEFPPTYRKVSADDEPEDGASGGKNGMRWEDSENPDGSLTLGREVIFAVKRLQTAADGLLVIVGTLQSTVSGETKLGPTDAPIVLPKSARTQQDNEKNEERSATTTAAGAGTSKRERRSSDEGTDRKASSAKRQKKQKTQKENSSAAMEQKLLEENGGAPLTHKQQRILKKMKKAEEAAAKRAAAAAAL